MSTKYCGIDYSLTSPAICMWDDTLELKPTNCKVWYLTSIKKSIIVDDLFEGELYPNWETEQERHYLIYSWVSRILSYEFPKKVFIEGYSYGSVGRVFNLAENMGLLKHKLWMHQMDFLEIPPTTIKKHAVGKGNATKETMNAQYIIDGGPDLRSMLKMTASQWNPSSDIIDSYYIMKTGVEKFL